jgi:FAD binding domain/Berberine and berberine like
MLAIRTLDDTTVTISDDALAAFKGSFGGRLLTSGDEGYDEARRVWNSLIDRRPGLIAQVRGPADVVRAVTFARTHGLLVAVRGGGHNVSGSAVCDGGLVIDLREMHAVRVDRKTMTVHVQGGARLADIDRETQIFGLVTPTGNVSDTGIGGLALCGGMSNLRRKFGLAVDNMVSVEMVTSAGEVMTASAQENADLFWAVRGGGGNFGVVTSFEFRLYPLGPDVYFAAQFFAIKDAPQVMRKWRDFVEAADDEISSLGFLWTVPAVDGFPPELHSKRVFLYGALYAGSPEVGEKALAPLQRIGTPVLDLSGRGPFTTWQKAFDPFFVRGPVYPEIYAYWKSSYLGGLGDGLIDDLVTRAEGAPTDQCLTVLWHLGGAVARPKADDTAFGKRNAPYLLSYDSSWTDRSLSDAVVQWTRDQIEAAKPHSPGGSYLNFPGVGADTNAVREAYGANYDRLAAIKAKLDPANMFRMNQNIVPAA